MEQPTWSRSAAHCHPLLPPERRTVTQTARRLILPGIYTTPFWASQMRVWASQMRATATIASKSPAREARCAHKWHTGKDLQMPPGQPQGPLIIALSSRHRQAIQDVHQNLHVAGCGALLPPMSPWPGVAGPTKLALPEGRTSLELEGHWQCFQHVAKRVSFHALRQTRPRRLRPPNQPFGGGKSAIAARAAVSESPIVSRGDMTRGTRQACSLANQLIGQEAGHRSPGARVEDWVCQ